VLLEFVLDYVYGIAKPTDVNVYIYILFH